RDPNDPNNTFNATTADDELVDTAANTEYYHGGTYPYITPACGYDGNETDEEGFVYNISPEDVQNAMSDAYPCVNNNLFTMGRPYVCTSRYILESMTIRLLQFLPFMSPMPVFIRNIIRIRNRGGFPCFNQASTI